MEEAETDTGTEEKEGWLEKHQTLDPRSTPTRATTESRKDKPDPEKLYHINNDTERAHIWAQPGGGDNGNYKKGEPAFTT